MYELQWITRKPDAEKQLFVVVGANQNRKMNGNRTKNELTMSLTSQGLGIVDPLRSTIALKTSSVENNG